MFSWHSGSTGAGWVSWIIVMVRDFELTCCRKNVGHGSVTLANADKATQQPSSLSSWHQLTAPQSRLLGGEFILQTAAIESCRAGTALGYTDVSRVRDIKIIKWSGTVSKRSKRDFHFGISELRLASFSISQLDAFSAIYWGDWPYLSRAIRPLGFSFAIAPAESRE